MTKKNYKCQNLLNSSILHQTDECQECDVAEYGEEDTSTETNVGERKPNQTSTSHTNNVKKFWIYVYEVFRCSQKFYLCKEKRIEASDTIS